MQNSWKKALRITTSFGYYHYSYFIEKTEAQEDSIVCSRSHCWSVNWKPGGLGAGPMLTTTAHSASARVEGKLQVWA